MQQQLGYNMTVKALREANAVSLDMLEKARNMMTSKKHRMAIRLYIDATRKMLNSVDYGFDPVDAKVHKLMNGDSTDLATFTKEWEEE